MDRVDSEFRVIWIPQDPNDLNFSLLVPRESGVLAVSFSGCKPGETIGVIEAWCNLEYIPDETYLTVVSQSRSVEPTKNIEKLDRMV